MALARQSSGVSVVRTSSISGATTTPHQYKSGVEVQWLDLEFDPSIDANSNNGPGGMYFAVVRDTTGAVYQDIYTLPTANDAGRTLDWESASGSVGGLTVITVADPDPGRGNPFDPATTSVRMRILGSRLVSYTSANFGGRKLTDIHNWKAQYSGFDSFFYEPPMSTWSANDEPNWEEWYATPSRTQNMFSRWELMNSTKLLNWSPDVGNYDGWFRSTDSLTQPIAAAWNLQPLSGELDYTGLFSSAQSIILWDSGACPTKAENMYIGSNITDAQVSTQILYWDGLSTINSGVDASLCFSVTPTTPRSMNIASYNAAYNAYLNLQNTHGWNWGGTISWTP
jgi:hypothetical protein